MDILRGLFSSIFCGAATATPARDDVRNNDINHRASSRCCRNFSGNRLRVCENVDGDDEVIFCCLPARLPRTYSRWMVR